MRGCGEPTWSSAMPISARHILPNRTVYQRPPMRKKANEARIRRGSGGSLMAGAYAHPAMTKLASKSCRNGKLPAGQGCKPTSIRLVISACLRNLSYSVGHSLLVDLSTAAALSL